jgi:hypothetical protein
VCSGKFVKECDEYFGVELLRWMVIVWRDGPGLDDVFAGFEDVFALDDYLESRLYVFLPWNLSDNPIDKETSIDIS